jgi:hypothetical protein
VLASKPAEAGHHASAAVHPETTEGVQADRKKKKRKLVEVKDERIHKARSHSSKLPAEQNLKDHAARLKGTGQHAAAHPASEAPDRHPNHHKPQGRKAAAAVGGEAAATGAPAEGIQHIQKKKGTGGAVAGAGLGPVPGPGPVLADKAEKPKKKKVTGGAEEARPRPGQVPPGNAEKKIKKSNKDAEAGMGTGQTPARQAENKTKKVKKEAARPTAALPVKQEAMKGEPAQAPGAGQPAGNAARTRKRKVRRGFQPF